ncbi:MAG: hypothetical protein V3U60_16060 [Gammaproteobacteria bacterium]
MGLLKRISHTAAYAERIRFRRAPALVPFQRMAGLNIAAWRHGAENAPFRIRLVKEMQDYRDAHKGLSAQSDTKGLVGEREASNQFFIR